MPAVLCVLFQSLSLAVSGASQNLKAMPANFVWTTVPVYRGFQDKTISPNSSSTKKEDEPLRELDVARLYWKSREAHVDLFDAVKNTASRPFIDRRVRRRNLQDASDEWRRKGRGKRLIYLTDLPGDRAAWQNARHNRAQIGKPWSINSI